MDDIKELANLVISWRIRVPCNMSAEAMIRGFLGLPYTVLLPTEMHISIRGQLLLGLTHQGIQPCLDIRQSLTDVLHEDL